MASKALLGWRVWAMALLLTFTAAHRVGATGLVRHVAPWGSDSNPGTLAEPFGTIQFAIDSSASNDTIFLADGTYSGEGNRDIRLSFKAIWLGSRSNNPAACIIDCSDPSAVPHVGIILAGPFSETPSVVGLTITGAVDSEASRGALSMPDYCDRGSGSARLSRLIVRDNVGSGLYIGVGQVIPTVDNCTFSYNTHNGVGMPADGPAIRGGEFTDCSFEHNGRCGVVISTNWTPDFQTFVRCRFNDNFSAGVQMINLLHHKARFVDCQFERNGYGISCGQTYVIENSIIADNRDWGVFSFGEPGTLTLANCTVTGNARGGVRRSAYVSASSFIMTNCYVAGNGGPAIMAAATMADYSVRGCVIVDNDGPGIAIGPAVSLLHLTASYEIVSNTISRNRGAGIRWRMSGLDPATDEVAVAIENNIISAQDTSVSIQGLLDANLSVSCCNIFGNATGDWTGSLAPWLGANGNIAEPPLFCGAHAIDPWTLRSDSPCSVSGPCGLIGARDVGCGPNIVSCRSLQTYDPQTGMPLDLNMDQEVVVEGVVYVAPGAYGYGSGGYLQDTSGGINFWRDGWPDGLGVGDRIRVTGLLWPWLGELYIGNATWVSLGTSSDISPVDMAIGALQADLSVAGSHVRVGGRIADLQADSFWLEEDSQRIQVRQNGFAGVSFAAFHNGQDVSVDSPCFIENGVPYLKPAMQAGLSVRIGACKLVGPPTLAVGVGQNSGEVRGSVLVEEMTAAAGPLDGMVAELGWGPVGSNPSSSAADWEWASATWSRDDNGSDEYVGQLCIPVAGAFDYAFRFVLNGLPPVYADLDGSVNGYSTAQVGRINVGGATGSPMDGLLALRLYPAQPNPFNPSTAIRFELPSEGHVGVAVYDLQGRMVAMLLDVAAARGVHEVVWGGRDGAGRSVSSGVYVVRLAFNGRVMTKSIHLVR